MSQTADNSKIIRELEVRNRLGLHARPASLFVQLAITFQSEIEVENFKTGIKADGKSVMSMLMLAAPCGTKLRLTVSGPDAEQAMSELSKLVESGFNDD